MADYQTKFLSFTTVVWTVVWLTPHLLAISGWDNLGLSLIDESDISNAFLSNLETISGFPLPILSLRWVARKMDESSSGILFPL